MNFEDLCEKHQEEVADKVKELNDIFMDELRKIDRDIRHIDGEPVAIAPTVAFTSLAMLAGHLLARYTMAMGNIKHSESMVKRFYSTTDTFYNNAMKLYANDF